MKLSIQEILTRKELSIIDVRTRQEYLQGSLSRAVSFPLFDEEERARIGTLYKQEGRVPATQEAYEIIANKMPHWLDDLTNKIRGRKVAIMCWRGGMRSESVVTLLRAIGYEADQVEGGYKAYRGVILSCLASCFAKDVSVRKLITLYGLTGTGKTLILKELQKRGLPVIDLEGLANHRGSAFGHIGLGEQPTQQWFETRLFDAVREFEQSPYLFVEGESQRIGSLFLPAHFMESMQRGYKIFIRSSLEKRTERILSEYFPTHSDPTPFQRSIKAIERRLGLQLASELHQMLERGEVKEAAAQLLVHYYDKCYDHARKGDKMKFDFGVDHEETEETANHIERWLSYCWTGP
ncbi:MAG: tRNA 2-selenouridine(34) synthase MnmH [Deltaproteobacteria bacterium]|nr:tRNA 2-selenouridine(34) synthase MnmH [Deltaproteobacteria bacterium]